MLRHSFMIGALMCLAMPAPAVALDKSDREGRLGRAVLNDFAKCVVKRNPDLSKKMVLNTPEDSPPEAEVVKLLHPWCVGLWGVHLRASDLALRAALAEELVRASGRWPELSPSAKRRLDWTVPQTLKAGPGIGRLSPTFVQKTLESLAADARVGRLGECVVRTSPSGAAAVLNTKLDSKAEISALKALTPQIGGCMKAGETSAFNRTNLRQAIALSYYRLANAASIPDPEGGL